MALFSKQTAWDKIKAAVADAAERAGDAAGDWSGSARDAAADGWAATKSGVQSGASATGDAVRTGASAVGSGASAVGRGIGQGVAAVDHKVESVANGVVAGAIAGALATWAMNQFQAAQAKSTSAAATAGGGTSTTASAENPDENATVQVAEKVADAVGQELPAEQKQAAGVAVHYGYGAAMGALYGGLTEIAPIVGTGLGLPYATALWLFGDEIATSVLGLSKPPQAASPEEHAASLSSHFVYGVTLDIARRVLRHIV